MDMDRTMTPLPTASEKAPELESGIDKLEINSDGFDVNNEDEYASGTGLLLLIISLMLGMFLVALDNVCSSSPHPCYAFED